MMIYLLKLTTDRLAYMKNKKKKHIDPAVRGLLIALSGIGLVALIGQIRLFPSTYSLSDRNMASVAEASGTSSGASQSNPSSSTPGSIAELPITSTEPVDKELYDKKLFQLANRPLEKCSTTTPAAPKAKASASSSASKATTTKPKPVVTCVKVTSPWPVKAAYPNAGALLPFNRIVAYYGNFYSKNMGVLGQYSEDTVVEKLKGEISKWKAADPSTPVIAAIDYIAITAQGSPGDEGKYRLRMPDEQIQKAISLAKRVNGIVVLDVQMGQSSVQTEIPLLKKYLMLPNVHLALDPEFSMKAGQKPGSRIGSMSASEVNFAVQYLAKLVQDNNLPPKILVVHRFTNGMVTNTQAITPLPEVQIVMDMDGWGGAAHKRKAYLDVINGYPVQFTGFKLFYKNDIRGGTTMMTPAEVLKMSPVPSFIQYQ